VKEVISQRRPGRAIRNCNTPLHFFYNWLAYGSILNEISSSDVEQKSMFYYLNWCYIYIHVWFYFACIL